jgi:integrase
MRGSIRRRGKGAWELTIDMGRDAATGKRIRRFHTVRGTRRDAEHELTARLHALATGTYIDVARVGVAQFMEKWLADYAKRAVAPRTYERYSEIVALHLNPSLGSLGLSQLRPAHIVAAERAWHEGGLSAATVLKFHRLLREALHHAVRWQMLAVNPADAVTPPRVERREMSVLSPDQAMALLAAASGTEFEAPITTALYSGLRLGELRGLRWRDVDLAAGRLSVQQTLQKRPGGGVVARQPKTHRSRRLVSLPMVLAEVLGDHRRRQVEARLAAGDAWEDADLVFTDALGRPIGETHLRLGFWRLLRQAGLPRIRLHDLRHTMATLMLAAGEHPKVVSERLGHSTIAITLDTYSHVLPGLQAAAAERMAVTLGARGPGANAGDPRS